MTIGLTRLTPVLLLLLSIVLPAQLAAQPGRIAVTVRDASGAPVGDARVTLTTSERSDIRVESETNQRGKATVTVPNVTFVYDILIEADGHQSITTTIKPKLGEVVFHEYTLVGVEAAPAFVSSGEERVFSPAEVAFNAGVDAMSEGDLDGALEKFLEARAKDSELAVVDSGLATVYLEQGHAEEALAAVKRFLENEPKNPRGLRLLYDAHQRLGNSAEARAALKELAGLEKGGDIALLLFNEGAEAVKVGDLVTAEQRFVEALESKPDLAQAVDALMIVYARRGDWEKAVERAEQVLAADPRNARALSVRYDGYKSLGNAEKEKEALAALAAVNPKALVDTFLQSGIAKFNAGDAAGAIADLERVVDLAPENAAAHYYLGLGYTNAGQSVQAKTHLDRFLALAPDDPNAASAREMLKYLK